MTVKLDRGEETGRRPHTARVMAIAVHPYMKKRLGVLFWKGEEILDWYRGLTGRR